MKIFLCGDVMTARGIDQALPHPYAPPSFTRATSICDRLSASCRTDKRPRAAACGFRLRLGRGARRMAERAAACANCQSLETSITHSEAFEPKGINYRMSPQNALCLTAAALDCCVLANNHVLDWGLDGLLDTLNTLERLHIRTAGAGRNLAEAKAPAIIEVPDEGRLLVLALASETSGAPPPLGSGCGDGGG